MSKEKFNHNCANKIKRFSRRKKLLSLTNLDLTNFNNEQINVDHIIFGKKYIYLISNFLLKGFVEGKTNDTSWIYHSKITKNSGYISNFDNLATANINEFATILGVGVEPFIAISVVPNNCDFKVKRNKASKNYYCHFFSLVNKIKKLEREKIGSLDEQQIYEQYETIKQRNSERNA